MNATHLASGATFAGDFQIVAPLSEGGMGAVYVVDQLSTGKRRALKIMHASLVADPKLRERFAQEAKIGARIDSDHVVEVVGAGVDAATGMPWLAMELLQGETLADRVGKRGPFPIAEVREIFAQLGHALSAAHDAGVVHRDLKPENLFLAIPRREGVAFTVKILDFGIAKLVAESGVQTKTTGSIGTPLWMAPEQAEMGARIAPPTDVWALGLIAYHLLTARFYWRTANVEATRAMQLMREVLVDPLDPPSVRARELGVDLPAGFDAWFARCVDRDPAARFPNAREAKNALIALLGGAPSREISPLTAPTRSFSQTPVVAATAPMPMTPAAPPYQSPAPRRPPGDRRLVFAGVAFAVVALGGLAAWRIGASSSSSSATASSTSTAAPSPSPSPPKTNFAPTASSSEAPAPAPPTWTGKPLPAHERIAVAFVVDRSQSMEKALPNVLAAIQRAASALGAGDLVEVVAFDSAPSRDLPFSPPDARAMSAALSKLRAAGGSDLFPALDLAASDLEALDAPRKHVVLVSDDESPGTGVEALVVGAHARGVTFSVVAIGAANKKLALAIVGDGDGTFTEADPGDDVTEAMVGDFADALSHPLKSAAPATSKPFVPAPSTIAPAPMVAPSSAPATPAKGDCGGYAGDYVKAMKSTDYACVRAILLPVLDAGSIGKGQARYLKAACSALGDAACANRASAVE